MVLKISEAIVKVQNFFYYKIYFAYTLTLQLGGHIAIYNTGTTKIGVESELQ